MEKLEHIRSFLEECRPAMLELWQELVNMESYVGEPENVEKVLRRFKEELEKEGFSCRIEEVGGGWAGTLVGIWGEENEGEPILFSGHLDTVFPQGSWGEQPFCIQGDKAFGPGVLDMKGGAVIALYAAKALKQAGYRESPIKVIFSGNEENGHQGSTGAEVFLREAKGCRFAFNMETGRMDGCLCVGRKGHLGCRVTVEGVESHAGNDFESGRSAIEEAAHKVLAIQALTDLEEGTTVNVGVIQGGTVPNAVAGNCRMDVDIRVLREEGRQRVKAAIPQIVEHCRVEGTRGHVDFEKDAPIYETDEKVKKFYSYVCQAARQEGLPAPGQTVLGGFSDAAYISLAGTPVICSFGVQGEWNHTKREYAYVPSLTQRAELICAVVLHQKEF